MTKNRQRQPFGVLLTAMTTIPLLIGCPSTGDSPTPDSASPSPSPTVTNSPTPTPETPSASNLPEQPWSVPGWLALGTKPEREGTSDYPFSPINPEAEIAIFSEEWSAVPSDTALIALTPEGSKQEVQFRRSGEEPYGCDDLPTPMATFTNAQPLPEGGFWLLPASAADNAESVALEELPLDDLPTNLLAPEQRQATEARAWQAGNLIVLLAKQTDKQAQLTIANNSEEIFSTEVEVLEMEDVYEESLDLSGPSQPGIPQPIGVFQFDSGSQVAIALWYPSFEGHTFQVVAPTQGKMELFEAASVYYCGF